MIPIVITSINQPTPAIKAYLKLKNFRLVMVADNKSPKDYPNQSLELLTLSTQKKIFLDLAKALPTNSYCRKNLGYLYAWENFTSPWLFETDDDNFPLSTFTFPNSVEIAYLTVVTKAQFFNILGLFTKQKAWLRGFPLTLINQPIKYRLINKKASYWLIQSLINADSDFDAVYRLIVGRALKLKSNQQIFLAKNVYGQVNSQATWWHRRIASLMYFPITIPWRTADIWRGYVAQKIIWNLRGRLLYFSPQVWQKRLRHDLMADFQAEMPLYTKSIDFIHVLNFLKLSGSPSQQLYQAYSALIKQGFFRKRELVILNLWLKRINKLGL